MYFPQKHTQGCAVEKLAPSRFEDIILDTDREADFLQEAFQGMSSIVVHTNASPSFRLLHVNDVVCRILDFVILLTALLQCL